MANTSAVTLLGSGEGPVVSLGGRPYLMILGTFTAGSTYATGGQPVTLPLGVEGRKFKGILLMTYHDGTRTWVWDGSTSAPKLKAYDAFSTEEANATNVSAVSHTALFIFE
jgi:hypothetical protein